MRLRAAAFASLIGFVGCAAPESAVDRYEATCADVRQDGVARDLAKQAVSDLNVREDREAEEALVKRHLLAACRGAEDAYQPYSPVVSAYPDPVAGTEGALEEETRAKAREADRAATPMTDPDAQAVVEVIEEYYATQQSGETERTCALLTERKRKDLVARVSKLRGEPMSCVEAVELTAALSSGFTYEVVRVNVDGTRASACVTSDGDRSAVGESCITFSLVKQTGQWLIDAD